MSFDKNEYWKNRKEGKRGQSVETSVTELADATLPQGANVGFDNDGNMVLRNRAYRRKPMRLPVEKPKLSQKAKKKLRKKK